MTPQRGWYLCSTEGNVGHDQFHGKGGPCGGLDFVKESLRLSVREVCISAACSCRDVKVEYKDVEVADFPLFSCVGKELKT